VKLLENEQISRTALSTSLRDLQAYELFMAISVFRTTGTEREPYIYNPDLLLDSAD
jgi:DNA-binding transcriptional regulator GbsR (MarR family)